MTTEANTTRVSRFRVPRTRGALSGLLLVVLGAWAGIVAFIGPYLGFGFTPAPGTAWNWTAGRGYLEVIPGAAAFLAGLVLLVAAHRVSASLAAWLGAAAGAWLIVAVPLATGVLNIGIGTPDPAATSGVQALEVLFYFTAIGAAILAVSCVAIGRLAVRSERDVRLVERRAAAAPVAAAPAAATAPAEAQLEYPQRDYPQGPARHEADGQPMERGEYRADPGTPAVEQHGPAEAGPRVR